MTRRATLVETYIWRAELPARQAALNRLLGKFDAVGRAARVRIDLRRNFHLALDEIVSNIVHANGRKPSTKIRIELILDRRAITLTVGDNGRTFDPTRARPVRGPVLERPVGGLGLQIVRGLMDRMTYARRGGWNMLTMTRATGRR